MPGRLVKVNCPHCGAPIRIDAASQFTSCEFCKRVSFVHQPREAIAPPAPGYEDYGHIQLPPSAARSPLLVPMLVAFLAFDVLIAVGVVVALIVSRSSPPASDPSPLPATATAPSFGLPAAPVGGSNACAQQLVRCCKALDPNNDGCNIMMAVPEADCVRQLPQLQQAARAVGRRCD